MSGINRRRGKRPGWMVGVIAAAAAGTLFLCAFLIVQAAGKGAAVKTSGSALSGDPAVDSAGFGDTILNHGKAYRYNTNLKNILLLGIDKGQSTAAKGIAARNGRSDTMILLTVDCAAKTTRILEISRDTMMNVDVYDANDAFQFSGKMQLTMQYAFSSSARRGCWLAAKKVSELLYGVPVDYTVSLTMDGIAPVVDALGGVKLTVPEDYTSVSPEFRKGAVLELNGRQAFQYVHYRNTAVTGSNDTRMERQMQFMQAFYRRMNLNGSGSTVRKLQDAAEPYLESNLDAENLQKLIQYRLQEKILKVPGKTHRGSSHDEYEVDDGALRQMVADAFYVPAS